MKSPSRAAPARRPGRRPTARIGRSAELPAGKVIDTFLRTLARLDPLAASAAPPAAAGGQAPPRSSPRGGAA
jgi:hypothetical protein